MIKNYINQKYQNTKGRYIHNIENENPKAKSFITLSFIIMEFCIYVTFMYLDINNIGVNTAIYLKFAGIILCFIYSLLPYTEINDRSDLSILRGALFFTVISDLLILMLDFYTWGVFTFCIVQLLYLIRLSRWRSPFRQDKINKTIIINILRNLGIAFVVLLLLVITKIQINRLLVITAFYFISIVFNVIDAIIIAFQDKIKYQLFFAVGMILFLCCDINVGIFNLGDFVILNSIGFSGLYHFSTIAMWMFYLPAQVGISLSKCQIRKIS